VRRRLVLTGAAALGLGCSVAVPAQPAAAAATTLYASPSGTGTSCSAAQPCSLSAAQAAVRSMVAGMSDDIVVQLADGVYRLPAPMRLTAADSGTNGHTVRWQANVGTGVDARQVYVDGAEATRARTVVNRSDLAAGATGLRFTNSALGSLNNLANQNRVEVESIGSFTDRYSPVAGIANNLITMQQPARNNNNFGYDTFASPFRASTMYLENAYEFLDSPGEWYLNAGAGTLSYIPLSGQNLSSADVELPLSQSLVDVGGTYDAPAHDITLAGVGFAGTSWLGPSGNQGYADQQTGAYLAGTWNWPAFGSCTSGCTPFEAARPHWSQMPAAVQVSAANTITFTDDQFVNLGQNALGIGNDANAQASGVGLGASSITVTDNLVHDTGLDYRGITSFLPTYVTNATISHNEIYNMPYSGLSDGFGWGANDAGGSNDYANRGLYNYQLRYSTPTTATNNRITDNYVHDIMQQMNDGGCIYTLSANPNAVVSGNYCLHTHGYFGLYFDEGSRYHSATGNVFSDVGVWSTANANANNNTGNLTLTGNWTTNGATSITNGNRGNTVSNNTTVTDNNWPSGAQAVMANAGIRSGSSGQQNVEIVGASSGRCVDVPNASQTNGTQIILWSCNGGSNQQWSLRP
jgi:hypothetical protein